MAVEAGIHLLFNQFLPVEVTVQSLQLVMSRFFPTTSSRVVLKNWTKGSVVEALPSMYEIPGLIPSTSQKRREVLVKHDADILLSLI